MNISESSSLVPTKTIVLIGMMGVGKSSVGRKLAARMAIPFIDSDTEIEAAAGMDIAQFFSHYGEDEFRKGERRVIARLMEGPVHVLSTGGGAFMDPGTRALVRAKGISVWLKADPAILLERALRRDNRPLLAGGDPAVLMAALQEERDPYYAEADIAVESDNRPVEETVDRVLNALDAFSRNIKTAS